MVFATKGGMPPHEVPWAHKDLEDFYNLSSSYAAIIKTNNIIQYLPVFVGSVDCRDFILSLVSFVA